MIAEKDNRACVRTVFQSVEKKEYFGRTIVEDITGLKSTRASELIKIIG